MTKAKTYTYRGVTFRTWKTDEINLTEKRIKNLLDMAYAIQNAPPPKFDMGGFNSFKNKEEVERFLGEPIDIDWGLDPYDLNRVSKLTEEEINICGTSACAIGTAAFNGVGRLTKDMTWDEYSVTTFGIEEGTYVWSFLFSGSWGYEGDNTPEGAVARILMLIDKGPSELEKFYVNNSYRNMIELYQGYKSVVLEKV